jgi:hypothetical protein
MSLSEVIQILNLPTPWSEHKFRNCCICLTRTWRLRVQPQWPLLWDFFTSEPTHISIARVKVHIGCGSLCCQTPQDKLQCGLRHKWKAYTFTVRIPFKGILRLLKFSSCNIRRTFPPEIRHYVWVTRITQHNVYLRIIKNFVIRNRKPFIMDLCVYLSHSRRI